ncbi:transcription termination factor NusA [Periweissella beninensis]|uniref:Transcription termination/antitermination protein NusA n=1 Tax=Periweissella beninensis TaxID=504936 RepID=A0ABT0VFH0_9LACO|nr:transcription termination factor NusA [Periweissella beninensis]MBM7543608.1 N utilization substance protein A [Periweissella beninensis]MCM2436589.1 transcription termination/antitermination protein NusA [Periweissella beninensis]MCT4395438.1 transcription termination/antitermination protein NusA [Periweissella beninensis]
MSKEMIAALDALEQEKGVKKEIVIDSLEAALEAAYKRNYDQAQNVEVTFEQKKGDITVMAVKTVVPDDEFYDETTQVTLKEALTINKAYEVGDEIRFKVTPKDFGRIAAQTAKQVIIQRVREAERSIVYNKFVEYEDEIITGEVERLDNRYLFVLLPGNQEAVMTQQDQMPNESYRMHDHIKVLVAKVENNAKGPQVFVSRTHPDLVKRLFEQEVPEVYDGTVEIMSIAREAGDRAKIAVKSNNPDLDPVGTMVGQRGARVQAVVNELSGENMDIVEWTDDAAQFIANALNPAEVVDVIFDEENERAATIIVPDSQLSLAIGKRGQNARLAARLTSFKIDIKPESEAAAFFEQQAQAKATIQQASDFIESDDDKVDDDIE